MDVRCAHCHEWPNVLTAVYSRILPLFQIIRRFGTYRTSNFYYYIYRPSVYVYISA